MQRFGATRRMARYNLDDLGWVQFEELCQALMKAVLSLQVESWGGTSDKGRDAYAEGPLILADKTHLPGPIAFQVKFVQRANAAGADVRNPLLKALKEECKKIVQRLESGDWRPLSNYFFLTNAPLTAALREEAREHLKSALGEAAITVWGANDICDLLDKSPNVRVAFPQLLGLRDLNELLAQVVDRPIVERSQSAIDNARNVARVFVPTRGYHRALEVLEKHRFAVLTGPPEMGKTTIARMIGLAKFSTGWDYFDCFEPDDFFQLVDDDRKQIFVADDAFGTTEYDPDRTARWGAHLPSILRRLRRNHWLVWTSRPTPLQMAIDHIDLREEAEHFPSPAQVTVDAASLTRVEKAKILYRHAKNVQLSDQEKWLLKEFCEPIVEEATFTPERIRRLVNSGLKDIAADCYLGDREAEDIESQIRQEISSPTQRMQKSFDCLDARHKRVLLAMLDVDPGRRTVNSVATRYHALFGPPEGGSVDDLIKTLDGHFLRLTSGKVWSASCGQESVSVDWIHPSWRDLTINYLSRDVTARHVFLDNCSPAGIALAVSIGGGEEGERAYPLISDEADLKRLRDRTCCLAQSGTKKDVYRLVVTVGDFLAGDNDAGPNVDELSKNKFGYDVLNTIVARWDRDKECLEISQLREFYGATLVVSPLVKGPWLGPTWKHVLSTVENAAGADEGEVLIHDLWDSFDGFVSFFDLIAENEPRFLRLVGLPVACSPFSDPDGMRVSMALRAQGETRCRNDESGTAPSRSSGSCEMPMPC